MDTFLNTLLALVEQGSSIRKQGKNKDIYQEILNHTQFLPSSAKIKERIYVLTHNLTDSPRCICGKILKFLGPSTGYRQFCSTVCSNNSTEVQTKKRTTCLINYGVSSPAQCYDVRTKMQDTTMKRFGVPHSQQSDIVKNKTKNTNLKNWGFESHTSSPEFQKQVKKNVITKYKVTHISKLPGVQEKIRQTTLQKYGVSHQSQRHLSTYSLNKFNDVNWLTNQHNDNKKTITEIAHDIGYSPSHLCKKFHKSNIQINNYFHSEGEHELYNLIKSMLPNEKILTGDRSVLHGKELDIYIPSKKLAFEFNGVYWHSELMGKNKYYHLHKLQKCQEQGIRLIHIWDVEWMLSRQIVISRINHMLHKSTSIYARKCSIVIPSKNEVKQFTNNCHIQKHVGYSISYGLEYDNNLVSLVTFGKSRFSSKYEYELLRYTNLLNTQVMGGASKLVNHFIKNHNPQSIITYSDKRWNTGKMYEKIGFQHINTTKQNYFYFDCKNQLKLFSRQVFQKHKLKNKLTSFDPNLTEWENMKNNGYNRIWDCGNDVYLWETKTNNSVDIQKSFDI